MIKNSHHIIAERPGKGHMHCRQRLPHSESDIAGDAPSELAARAPGTQKNKFRTSQILLRPEEHHRPTIGTTRLLHHQPNSR
jgi:hypothetical protein